MNDTRRARAEAGTETSNQRDWQQVLEAAPSEHVAEAVMMAACEPVSQRLVNAQADRPITQLPPQQRSSAIQTVIAELRNEGCDRERIAQQARVPELDPFRMHPLDVNSLLHWTQHEHPQVLARVAARYQGQPQVLQALLGDRVLKAVVKSLKGSSQADRPG